MIPALVLGSGLTALGVMRRLGAAGIPVFFIGSPPGVEAASRWRRPLPVQTDGRTPVAGLADILRAAPILDAVVVPCSDHWALQVAGLPEQISSRFRSSTASIETLRILTDKALFSRLLVDASVPHPLTLLLERPEDVDAIPDEALENAFLKPHDSQAFFARYGVKGFHVRNRAEMIDRVAEVGREGLSVLLQQYIPGPGSLHYFVDGFVDSGGVLRAIFARHRLRMYPEDFGNSSFMVSIPPEQAAQAIDSLKTILPRLAYRGIFSAEFKRDPRDGLYKLLEINARPWWYVEFAARCGVDVCRMAYDDALGRSVQSVQEYRVGARMVYPYYDFFACREAWRRGELSISEWARSWAGAQNPLFNWTDSGPALAALWAPVRRRLGRPGRSG
jgi:D-aspartate ligase